MRAIAILMATTLAWATLAAAQEGPKTTPQPPATSTAGTATPANPSRSGNTIGGAVFVDEMAPDFELDGSLGRLVQPSKLRGDWVVMVFSERREGLQELASIFGPLRRLGAVIVGVCDENARTLQKAHEREPWPFVVAADPSGEVSAMYGVYDRLHSTTGSGFFVIDRRGVVRLAVIGPPVPPDEILSLAKIPMGAAQ